MKNLTTSPVAQYINSMSTLHTSTCCGDYAYHIQDKVYTPYSFNLQQQNISQTQTNFFYNRGGWKCGLLFHIKGVWLMATCNSTISISKSLATRLITIHRGSLDWYTLSGMCWKIFSKCTASNACE